MYPDRREVARANLRPAPPAPKRNRRASKHGLRAQYPAGIEAAAADVAEGFPVRDATGHVPAQFRLAAEALATAVARKRSGEAWLNEHGPLDENGAPRPAAELLEKTARSVERLLAECGMTPRAAAALNLDVARSVDLASAMSEPDPVLRRELLRQAGVIDAEVSDE